MTYTEKLLKLEELRELWKKSTGVDRKIIEKRGLLIKWTLPRTLISTID